MRESRRGASLNAGCNELDFERKVLIMTVSLGFDMSRSVSEKGERVESDLLRLCDIVGAQY